MKVKIRPGDTFWFYSQLFTIPYQLIEDANKQTSPNSLQIGQEIHIPGFVTEPYLIKKGDSFWKIAQSRNIPLDAILLLNQEVNPYTLPINTTIYLPKRIVTPIVTQVDKYDFQQMQKDLQTLQEIYPFLTLTSAGESVLKKPIYEVTLGRGSRVVHINGAFHANEWITVPVIMRILNEYLLSLMNGNPIKGFQSLPLYLKNRLSIVPMVNPDGVDLVLNGPSSEMRNQLLAINEDSEDFSGWKANIRGVDLNNQYPANWEIEKERKIPKSPAPRDYPGDAPLTEPEAIAMKRLAETKQFSRVLAFHTQGREIYWGYEGLEPPESEILAREFARVSGYEAVRYIDSHAGYKDWFIQTFRRPGFTFELGLGVNPLPISQFPMIYEEMLGVFFVALFR